MFLGSYIDFSRPDYYVGVVKHALSIGANCFMFYTGSPQNTVRLPTQLFKINEAREIIKKNNIDETKIVIHAAFIINLANANNIRVKTLAIDFLKSEIERAKDFNVKILVVHPGCFVDSNEEIGIKTIINNLNIVLDKDNSDVKIALETMSGKGSEIGYKFEQIKKIIDGVHKKDRIGVCFDICHVNDAGYNIHNIDEILKQFDKIIGLKKILVIHVSDSLNVIGSHKDRHANIGLGKIGFETISKYVNCDYFKNIPRILETPMINGKYIFDEEIKALKKNKN